MWQITTIPRNFRFCKVRLQILCVCVVIPLSNIYLSIHLLLQVSLGVNKLLWVIPNLPILGSSYLMTLVKINSSVRIKTVVTVSVNKFEDQTSVIRIAKRVMYLWPYTEKMKVML